LFSECTSVIWRVASFGQCWHFMIRSHGPTAVLRAF
jgi:hypothetical protein